MRRQHTYLYTIICSICLLLISCDHIAEDERLIYEKPEPSQRVVLLEDFTGQRCVNCPTATDVIEQLQETFGENVVAVGIHGGKLAVASTPKVVGLKTDTGDEYNNHWGVVSWPMGLINRHELVNHTDWVDEVKKELAKPAPLHLLGYAELEDDIIHITIDAEGTDGTVTGKLQVWLLEDGIKALQLMPDGSANQEYIHNHVFRTAVNGTWGEDFSINEGETTQQMMTQELEPNWNPEQLSIVAFVYNDNGVQQATKFNVQ